MKFPLIGTLVDGTSLDDSLWLVTNGLLSVVVANRTWRPEFRAAFRETWGLIASLVDRVVGSRAHRSPAVAPRTPTIDDAKRSVERIKTLASRPELRDGSRDARAATEKLAEKIERGVLHIGVVGRISSGKTALARQLLGEPDPSFSSPIGGTTRTV
ncbi:MAG: hypothetical protein KC466_03610, partial [Myxococcales bacterium]|nr:hypothetical protein [Myxococcales bacterium]